MKVSCKREQLLAAFQVAATVAPSRSPKPVLQNVKFEATSESTIVMATDLEVGVRLEVQGVEVETPGSALLPVTRFGGILRESNDDTLVLESDEAGATVKGEHAEFRLSGGDPSEFPSVTNFAETNYVELPARLLRELIRRTQFATDTESSRYALGGVLLEISDGTITAVGTDGRRLAKMEGPIHVVGDKPSPDAMTIVPTRSMQLIERALSDDEEEVQIAARTNDVLVRSSRLMLYSRLVEGRFPKWRDVFPTRQNAVQIDISVGPLYAALRQAAVVASEESRGIDFSFGEGSLVLSALTAEVGQSRVDMPIAYDGGQVEVTLDNRFVADLLKVLDPGSTVQVELEDADSAVLFATDENRYGYVIMPLARDR